MFTIYITLKSFESYYIEKNAAFLKSLLLLSKNNTVNIQEIGVREILGLQIPEKSKLTLGEKQKTQNDTSKKNEVIGSTICHGAEWLCKQAPLQATVKTDVISSRSKLRPVVVGVSKQLLPHSLAIFPKKKPSFFQKPKPESLLKKNLFSDSLLTGNQAEANKNRKNQDAFYLGKNFVDLGINEGTFSEISGGLRSYIRKEKNFNEINLPIKQKLFTVLRSVHVHKKSRLQFHFTYYIKKLTFQAVNVKMMFLILYIVKNAEFYGVELEISFNHKTV